MLTATPISPSVVSRANVGVALRVSTSTARLQRGEALLRGQRRDLVARGVVEHRRRDGAAHVDVQAVPGALGVHGREALDAGGHAALHVAFLLTASSVGPAWALPRPQASRQQRGGSQQVHEVFSWYRLSAARGAREG